jgi:aspartate kinase
VADRVAAAKAAGKDVVVVVSAMGDTTDDLLQLARQVTDSPARRELDIAAHRRRADLDGAPLDGLERPQRARGQLHGLAVRQSSPTTPTPTRGSSRFRPFRVQDELERARW